MKRDRIDLRINDTFLAGEIDYRLHEQPIRRSQPDGLKTLVFLETIFTANTLTRYKDKLHFIKAEIARQKHPELLRLLKESESELKQFYEVTKKETATIPFYQTIYKHLDEKNYILPVQVLISPVAMTFISIIALTDNLVKQLRIQQLSGHISKKHFYRQRSLILKKFSNLRTDIFSIEISHKELIKQAIKSS